MDNTNALIFFILTLIILLIILNMTIIYNTQFFEPIRRLYARIGRKVEKNNYIKQVSKQPLDSQKTIFKETSLLLVFLFILFLIASKVFFFSAVLSESMNPTFNKNDLVLMQNLEHSYKPGDIIMFNRPDTAHPVSHRIKLITEKGIRTTGDATGQIDWWDLQEKDIIGKAVLIQGKPVVIKGYGKYFILDQSQQNFGVFGQDYQKYLLFFQVIKIYGYVIAVGSLVLYVALTIRQKPWKN